jgi:hypothetical protein
MSYCVSWWNNIYYIRLFMRIGTIRAISSDHQNCGRVINILVLYSRRPRFKSLPGDTLLWHSLNAFHQSLLLYAAGILPCNRPRPFLSADFITYQSKIIQKLFCDPVWFGVGFLKPTQLGLGKNNDKDLSPNGIWINDLCVSAAKDHEHPKPSDMIPLL